MFLKKVNSLTIGDVLAENIFNDSQLLFEKGTLLTLSHIITLLNLNYEQVKVEKTPHYYNQEKSAIDYSNLLSSESAFLERIFQEFILFNNQNDRLHNIISSEDELTDLCSLFVTLLSNDTINNLLSALKAWDKYSYYHGIDVFIIGTQWLKELHSHENIHEIATGFLLHDIGKIRIPRDLLQKQGKLVNNEFDIIKTHVYFGEELLNKVGFSKTIKDMAMYHHTSEDGNGYPDKFISSHELPSEVKILSIIDVFSALTLDRPYRQAYTVEQALKIMEQYREKFDQLLFQNFVQFIVKSGKKITN